MALNDTATLVVGAGNFFTGPVDTAPPADLKTGPFAAWENIGHTSLEDIIAWESEGGEQTILGTLQNKKLRSSYSDSTESFTINLQQWDEDSLKLFFGTNGMTVSEWFRIPTSPAPTVAAFMAIFIDGANVFGIHVPKAEIYRGDAPQITDTESLASLPIKVTPMISGTNTYAYQITPLGTTTP